MTIGHFLWTDLSTYDMQSARSDYATIFDWKFAGDEAYDFARNGNNEVAAIFTMPAPLAEINLPSFWMSYVHVQNVAATVERAKAHEGVVIEVAPQDFNGSATIALIRDPSGAGFTVYEGPDITPVAGQVGTTCTRLHHVRDIALIERFYNDLFDWEFRKRTDAPWPIYDIHHSDGSIVAQAEEATEAVRGKFCYWMPSFGVRDTAATVHQIEALGGSKFADLPEARVLVADQQGAHFMVEPCRGLNAPVSTPKFTPPATARPHVTTLTIIGLAFAWLAVFLNIEAFWGILFLTWALSSLRTGVTYVFGPIARGRQPNLFWATVGTWLILSVWLIVVSIGSFLNS